MTAGQINKELDRLSKVSSKLIDKFIAVGRGHERISEIREKKDPLALAYIDNLNRTLQLRSEIERRYGPGAPSRLPRGFGPIRRIL